MATHILDIAGRKVKVQTDFVCPSIPFRSMDWRACEDGCEEDGMYGEGATEQEALDDIFWKLDEKYNPIFDEVV